MDVFLDSDGCAMDFNAHVFNHCGKSPNSLGDDALWSLVISIPDFWLSMPLMDGYEQVYAATKRFNPSFLTGCPRTDYDRAAKHKVIKLNKHYPGVPVITCLSRDKTLHMTNPGDVLIDDRGYICKKWEKAGGTAIRFKSPEQAVQDFLKIIAERDL